MSQINSLSSSGGGGSGGGISVTGTAQTIGATTADVITLSLGTSATTKIAEVKVVGFEPTNPSGCGYNIIGTVRTTGAAATFVGSQDKFAAEVPALLGCDANFVVAGNNLIVRVTGSVGLTLQWKAILTYISV